MDLLTEAEAKGVYDQYELYRGVMEPSDSAKKPTNPKDALGSGRVPMSLFPDTVVALGSMAFLEGALKYGRYNWRDAGVRASIYSDALDRHMSAWWNGEDVDLDSGLDHLVKALACVAILIDAKVCDKFIDDRPTGAPFSKLIRELTPLVGELKERLGDD